MIFLFLKEFHFASTVVMECILHLSHMENEVCGLYVASSVYTRVFYLSLFWVFEKPEVKLET